MLLNCVKVLCRPRVILNPTLEHCISPAIAGFQCRFKSKKERKNRDKVKTENTKKAFFKKKKVEEVIDPSLVSLTPSTDDVWNRKYFPVLSCSFLEGVKRHREYASPEMTDNLEGAIVLEIEFDLTTKKKTKFVGPPSGIILLPNTFDNFFPGRVIAITKTHEDQAKAEAAGALYTGGLDLIRKIEKGDIKGEDYDHLVLNNDLVVEAAIIKRIVKDLFPTKKNGKLGDDIEKMVRLFVDGKDFQGSKLSDTLGKLIFPIGKLSMSDEHLVENIKTLLATINEQKQSSAGPNYLAKLSIQCPPSKEVFVIKDDTIMPPVVARERRGRRNVVEEEEEVDLKENDDDDARANVASA